MIRVKKEGVLIEGTEREFENEGVLNPAVIKEGNKVHVFYRAVRKGNHSTIGYCYLDGPLGLIQRNDRPLLSPEFEYESQGIEDPRIVKIEDLYYLTFTAYNGVNALGALATSRDLLKFERKGIIVPQISFSNFYKMAENNIHLNEKYKRYHIQNDPSNDLHKKILLSDKNVIFFPRKINGEFYFLHRIRPDIQIGSFNSVEDLNEAYWEDYLMHFDKHILMSPKYSHEISYIGGGCPPIETKAGWVLIYHGVCDTAKGYVYSACASLLDLENPELEIARLPYALFSPELPWEVTGEVNNVVFPTGTALFGDKLYIYYGAADTRIAVASLSMEALLAEFQKYDS